MGIYPSRKMRASTKQCLVGTIICSLAALFYVYDYFIQVAPSVMVQSVMRDFNVGAGDLGALSACFFYAYAMMQIPAGWLLDHLGARKLLSLAVLISAVGVILFSQAPSFAYACVGRFLIGFGSAFAFVGTLFLLSQWFSHKHFAMLAGFVQFGGCLGSIIGLTPVALLFARYGWRYTLLVTGIATLGWAFVFWLVIRDRPAGTKVQVLRTATKPRVSHKQLFKNKQVLAICACGFFSWIPVAGVGALWGVPYIMSVYHLTNAMAAAFIIWFWLGVGLGSPLMGWLSHYFSRRKAPILICFVCAIFAGVCLLDAVHLPQAITMGALFVLGFSASVQSLTFGILKDIVPTEQFSFASGMNNMAAIVGGGLAQPIIGIVLYLLWNGHYSNGVPVYTLANYQHSLYLLPAIAITGLLIATRLKETRCMLLSARAL